jgi:DUF1680 family protein
MHDQDPDRSDSIDHSTPSLSRRQMLEALGAGALVALAGSGLSGCASIDSGAPPMTSFNGLEREGRITRAVPLKVQPFDLADVRLLDSPFLDAQKRDEKYLLALEPDRMLHNFRVNAKLAPKAPVYGGWESAQTWEDIRCHGHTLGHYLTACALMYASTGDVRFKQRVDYCVAELQACQNVTPSGLVCAFPDNGAQFDNVVAGRRMVGVPWYTMHKIFAGLRDAHLYCDNAAALAVLIKLSDWADGVTASLNDPQMQRMLNTEHGGMNEVLADVYVLTADEKYLKLAQRFCHHAVLDPLAQQRDTLNGLHSNTQIPKFVGFNRLFVLTGQDHYRAAAGFFWQTVTQTRSFATGGNGDREHFFPVNQFPQHLSSGKTMETCCSHNMLRLTRLQFELTPTASFADYYERTLYNTILASQDPDSGMFTYFQSTKPGYLKIYCTPTESFWCCTGSGMENHAKYGDSIYFRDADSLFVNLFIPSILNWKEKNLTFTQTTKFPDEPRSKFTIKVSRPTPLALQLRHPIWCERPTVRLNGQPVEFTSTPGSWLTLDRVWKTGDTVEIDLPMTLRAEPLPGTTNQVAILYGPLVLVGKMGTEGITPGVNLIQNERTIGDILNANIEIPTLAGDAKSILQSIQPVMGQPLTFATKNIGRPKDVTLVPYHRVAHERYNMYWTIG